MVQVFREVKRVLRDDGTLWLNLGDSYYGGGWKGSQTDLSGTKQATNAGILAGKDMKKDAPHHIIKTKDLVGIPWMVAFALRADGWYLRQDIIWHKPNPMPESVRDRCTKAHEYIFLLSKNKKYYYDADAIKEESVYSGITGMDETGFKDAKKFNGKHGIRFGGSKYGDNDDPKHATKSGNIYKDNGTRNKRSVWTVPTAPFSDWTQTYHLSRVEQDGPCDGRMHIVSPNCQQHGGLFDLLEMALCGEHAVDYLTHIVYKCENLSQEQFAGFLRTAKPLDYYLLGDSLDCFLQQCFPSATDRNTESHKKARALLTNPSCKPSAERLTRIQRILGRYGLFVIDESIFENNTLPDEMAVHSLGQTICRTVNKSSFNKLLKNSDCQCGLYHVSTKKSSHFATFPPKLIEPCILAGCPEQVCKKCGKPRERVVEKKYPHTNRKPAPNKGHLGNMGERAANMTRDGYVPNRVAEIATTGWTDCGCNAGFRPGIVLDPFMGSGTTAMVAYENNRHYIGCELNPEYCKLDRAEKTKDKYALLETKW